MGFAALNPSYKPTVADAFEKAQARHSPGLSGGTAGSLATGINGASQAGEINKSWRKCHGR
jgi:hypothetical protein